MIFFFFSDDYYEDDVRAPIPQKESILAADFGPAEVDPMSMMMRNFLGEADRVSAQRARAPPAARELNVKGLFRPPQGIMKHGNWQDVRAAAKEEKKWILVNVQDMAEFASQRLNRDTWSQGFVQELVSSAFVFWQVYHDSNLGREFLSLYPTVTQFPAICVIDGRTGRLREMKTGFVEPVDLVAMVSGYLDSHGGDDEGSAMAGVTTAAAADTRKRQRDDHESVDHMDITGLDEDDELERAIKASLATSGAPSSAPGAGPGPSSAPTKPTTTSTTTTTATATATATATPAAKSAPQPLPIPALPAEPAATDPNSTRIQLRLADGSKPTRRFAKTDTVGTLYDLALVHCAEARESARPFELLAPGANKPLTEKTQTLIDAGLANAVVTFRWAD